MYINQIKQDFTGEISNLSIQAKTCKCKLKDLHPSRYLFNLKG